MGQEEFVVLASSLGNRRFGNEILREVERAVSFWREQGRTSDMTDLELDQFSDAFEHAEREAARHI